MNGQESFEYISKYYDLLYGDKNYPKEVDFIEQIFSEFGVTKRIVEFGCGTGNYTKILGERGYSVTGVDLSENMLNVAKQKCACEFIKGDMRDVALDRQFDACLAMFAVIGYVTTNSDVVKTLQNVRRHLVPGGLFVFDVWNGLAVMRNLPETRLKTIEKGDIKVARVAVPVLRAFDHICEVNYTVFAYDKNGNTCREYDEKHVMRFYFPQELYYLLSQNGFEVLKICPFLDLKGRVDESTWNMTIIARSV